MVGYEARRREGGGGVRLAPKGYINTAGLGVIWNLITQTALYP